MLRVASFAMALTIALTGNVTGQQRADFSGDWALVPDASTPANQPALGSRARILQRSDELALELTLWFSGDGSRAYEDTGEYDAPKRYRLDGAEHSMAGQGPRVVRNADGSRRGSLMPQWPTAGRYRATWTGDKLVILSADQLPLLTAGEFRFVGLTIRTAFSLTADGLLVAERIAIQEPWTSPRPQPAPTPLRSVYRTAG